MKKLDKKSLLVVLILCLALIPVGILVGQGSESSFVVSAGPDGVLGTDDDVYVDSSGNVARGVAPMDLNSPTLLASAGAGEAGEQDVSMPNVEIPEGEALVFKGDDYLYLTAEDLLSPLDLDLKVDELGRPDLIGGSLYVPASVGDLLNMQGQVINWDVSGDIYITTEHNINLDDTAINSNGDINIQIPGNISAKSANITAGSFKLNAQGFIELDQATLSSGGNINIQTPEDISAKSAVISNSEWDKSIQITSTEGVIDISALEVVGIPQTVISCASGNIKIHASDNINAISTKMTTAHSSFLIEIISSAGQIDVSSSQLAGMPITDITSADNILVNAGQDIHCISSKITASNSWGKELCFESTGVGNKLYVNNADLAGDTITAINLQVEGTPASGTIN